MLANPQLLNFVWTIVQDRRASLALIEQVWFAGVHSDVGGGYPRQGLALIALDWMMQKAEARGLRFIESVRRSYVECRNTSDKSHDSRNRMGARLLSFARSRALSRFWYGPRQEPREALRNRRSDWPHSLPDNTHYR